jgi:hypothetical protein
MLISSFTGLNLFEQPHPTRERLPFLKDPKKRPSIWKVIKDMIGKDVTKISVPVYWNEPVSMI